MKMLGLTCFVIGCISFLFALIAYIWSEMWYGVIPIYPYRDYAFPLVFIGVVLVVVGWIVSEYGRKEEDKHQVPT